MIMFSFLFRDRQTAAQGQKFRKEKMAGERTYRAVGAARQKDRTMKDRSRSIRDGLPSDVMGGMLGKMNPSAKRKRGTSIRIRIDMDPRSILENII
jgi:hypothetical protein